MVTNKFQQTLTNKSLQQIRTILASNVHASLAVFEAGGKEAGGQEAGGKEAGFKFPAISRVSMAVLNNSEPVLLTSALSSHTLALKANPHCSLLITEIGKEIQIKQASDNDPMTRARVSLFCIASLVPAHDNDRLRDSFLARNPKAINYIDLPDFCFWRLKIEKGNFIAGFGRAYRFSGEQLRA